MSPSFFALNWLFRSRGESFPVYANLEFLCLTLNFQVTCESDLQKKTYES